LPSSSTVLNEAGKNGLTNISLSIRKGELVGLLGGMASGKSTLVTIQ
jgi:ABC-type multidrug transport system ATPase subunit